jgi:hypothetical protein
MHTTSQKINELAFRVSLVAKQYAQGLTIKETNKLIKEINKEVKNQLHINENIPL